MPETPGAVAYAAYWPALGNAPPLEALPPVDWHHLSPGVQRAWEAAAQAVLDQRDFPPLDLRPREEEPDA